MSADLCKLVALLGVGASARLDNYIVPGLRSTMLVAATAAGGKVRLFEMDREQEAWVTPHSHRYDFNCCVLDGEAENILYRVRDCAQANATHAVLPYLHREHRLDDERPRWVWVAPSDVARSTHQKGEWYGMRHDQFHSIRFSRGARVLFIEGPERQAESHCLVPYSGGRICSGFVWRDWMMTQDGSTFDGRPGAL